VPSPAPELERFVPAENINAHFPIRSYLAPEYHVLALNLLGRRVLEGHQLP
jgi:hypothetical protein